MKITLQLTAEQIAAGYVEVELFTATEARKEISKENGWTHRGTVSSVRWPLKGPLSWWLPRPLRQQNSTSGLTTYWTAFKGER
jgi:hypothetical protein